MFRFQGSWLRIQDGGHGIKALSPEGFLLLCIGLPGVLDRDLTGLRVSERVEGPEF